MAFLSDNPPNRTPDSLDRGCLSLSFAFDLHDVIRPALTGTASTTYTTLVAFSLCQICSGRDGLYDLHNARCTRPLVCSFPLNQLFITLKLLSLFLAILNPSTLSKHTLLFINTNVRKCFNGETLLMP